MTPAPSPSALTPPAPGPPSWERFKRERDCFLADRFPHFALSLAFNDPGVSPGRIWNVLKHLDARVNRELFGRNFNRRPAAERVEFCAFTEGVPHHPHIHMLWRVAPELHARFATLWPGNRSPLWTRFAPAGTHELCPSHDAEGWAAYCTKHVYPDSEWILSRSFHRFS